MSSIKSGCITDKVSTMVSNKIQILRGLAIIAVVFIHNTPGGLTQVAVRPFLNFCVGLFLFLSGILSSAEKWRPAKRIAKVLIPYAIWTLVYVVLTAYKTPLQIPFIFLEKLFLGNSAAMMYYILVYCEFTLLIPLIHKLAKSKYKYLGFAIAPIEIITMRFLPVLLGIELNVYVTSIRTISCLGWFTYFYLGYLMGNRLLKVNIAALNLFVLWIFSIALQIAEGYWYLSMGSENCGTQLKLSAVLSGVLFCMLAYRFIYSSIACNIKILKTLGDFSFGIYFSHVAIMMVLKKIPYYSQLAIFPINAIIVLFVSTVFVLVGKKILGKNSKYLAL